MKPIHALIITVIILSFAISAAFWPHLPQSMATHWDWAGNVNSHMQKFWGAFLVPIILAAIMALFAVIPVIDPLKKNYELFRGQYNGIIILIAFMMIAVQLHTLLWNIGVKLATNMIVPIIVGLIFFFVGVIIEKSKRNWFIGIRNPWTLSSDTVWEKTHRIGGLLFKISGVIVIAGIFFQRYIMYFILIPIIFTTLYTTVYSYLEYQRENSKKPSTKDNKKNDK